MRAILFDLDGTLLDIDLESFLHRYFTELESAASALSPQGDGASILRAIKDATTAMMGKHDGLTNQETFYADLLERTGIDLEVHWDTFGRFYEKVFPTLGSDCRPAKGARQAVETALSHGLKVAIATNPIFPRVAVDERLSWAGLTDLGLEVVTSYETMYACKPHPEYFRQTAGMVGVAPADCLMVGDDRFLDMPAADTGMRTFYVGADPKAAADYRGDLNALHELIPRLAST